MKIALITQLSLALPRSTDLYTHDADAYDEQLGYVILKKRNM